MSVPQPSDHLAERAVLAGAMLRNEAMHDLVGEVEAEDFAHAGHRAIWTAALALHERRQPIDPVTLENALRASDTLGLVGGLEGLGKIADGYVSSTHAVRHARTVAAMARRRRVVQVCREVADDGRGAVDDEDAWIETQERRVLEASQAHARTKVRDAPDVVNSAMEALFKRLGRKDPVVGISTGIPHLDRLIGGWQPGKLYVIAGRPGHGKSALSSCAAKAAALDCRHGPPFPSLNCNLEMAAEECMERQVIEQIRRNLHEPGIRSRIDSGKASESDARVMIAAADQVSRLPIDTLDAAGMTITQLLGEVRRWRYGQRCGAGRQGLVVIDYLQLIRPSRGASKTDSREQEVARISRDCKLAAKEMEIPILLLAQLSRKVDDRADHRPQLADLRESGAIEQDADVVIFTYRACQYMDRGSKEYREAQNDAILAVAKQRSGPTGAIPVHYYGEHYAFEGVPDGPMDRQDH